jgi:hypothetical protein
MLEAMGTSDEEVRSLFREMSVKLGLEAQSKVNP